jgi:PAS domain S-box-containing protein
MIVMDNLIQPLWKGSPSSIALITFDRESQKRKFSYVNPAFTALTGYSSAEAVGHSASLLNGANTSRTALEECEDAVTQGVPCSVAMLQYRKDGSEYAARAMIAPLVEPDGSVQFAILVETLIPPLGPVSATHSAAGNGGVVSLALPMPLKEFPAGNLPQHLVSHPQLDALQGLWTKLRGNKVLPERAEFDLPTMNRWAPHLSIATVMPTGRFQFRLFGTELARVYGQDLTGRFLDELTPRDLWSVIIRHYQDVVRTLQPLFAPISIANGRWYSEVSRLLLPLAANGGGEKVAFIMAADYGRTF